MAAEGYLHVCLQPLAGEDSPAYHSCLLQKLMEEVPLGQSIPRRRKYLRLRVPWPYSLRNSSSTNKEAFPCPGKKISVLIYSLLLEKLIFDWTQT